MAAIAGHSGRVQFGNPGAAINDTNTLPITAWQVGSKVDPIDVTTVESLATNLSQTILATYIAGVTDLDISFDCFWDTLISPMVPNVAPNIYPGSRLRLILFLVKASNTLKWDLAALVTDLNMSLDVRGAIRYSVMAKPSHQVVADTVNTLAVRN